MKARNWKAVRQEAEQAGRIDESQVAALRGEMLAQVRAYKLAEVRAASGLSQQELAEQLQVSQSRISRIEHGDLDRTELATLRKFARAIGGELELTLKLGDERFTLG
ncbi:MULTISPECIES: helix-turn-helix domain-containing protein [Deinococcus]|uniref:Transcriptional regulator n=2 Tax=Deinococcus TaxID=1298 RepID=A0AAV4K6T0_9DEIO|nr:XRE family transcriptional regulator [Deinococcus wulumuqiensis]QII22290.1 XRE family transcriptional regulator [Deinococcus wulumuqiensis R12]GGI86380.1 transcriptional regulator [Deinococcus wulumuqiensis]GGP30784.1 transcriptional regulator [Deinococcus wulumuqiensis]